MAHHQVAITGRSQCPAFDMKNMTFEEYIFDLELWASNCGLPRGKIVADIFLSLPVTDSSNIRRILRQKLSHDEMCSDGGFKKVVDTMKQYLGGNDLGNTWKKFCMFDNCIRKSDQTIEDFVMQVELSYNALEAP